MTNWEKYEELKKKLNLEDIDLKPIEYEKIIKVLIELVEETEEWNVNELKIFENAVFGKVRVVVKNDEVWFVAKGVGKKWSYMK